MSPEDFRLSDVFPLCPRPPDQRDCTVLKIHLYSNKNLWTVTTVRSAELNLIGSLVGKPARLTTGYTISLSNHALQLIYITLSYNISADPRPTPIAHLGRGRRPVGSPAAHSARQRLTCYILTKNHAHARHLSHTTHALKKLPTTTEPLTTPARSGCPN